LNARGDAIVDRRDVFGAEAFAACFRAFFGAATVLRFTALGAVFRAPFLFTLRLVVFLSIDVSSPVRLP
jgi:hypothetical protein